MTHSPSSAQSVELKPCPFCDFDGCTTSSNTIGTWRYAYCPGCLAEGPAKDADEEAIAAWNRRAAASAQATQPPDPTDIQGWSVTVNVNAQDILTIGHNSLSGIDNIGEFADVVRNCAEHLVSFIGATPPSPDAREAGGNQTPFSDCRFKICDLPGQCRGEGRCHHPAVPAASHKGVAPERINKLARTHLVAGDDGEIFGLEKFAAALLREAGSGK